MHWDQFIVVGTWKLLQPASEVCRFRHGATSRSTGLPSLVILLCLAIVSYKLQRLRLGMDQMAKKSRLPGLLAIVINQTQVKAQKLKIKERAGLPAKPSWRGQSENSCQFQDNSGKEGASATEDINVELNPDRSDTPVSTPIIHNSNYDINCEKVNPIISEHTSRDFDLHGDFLNEDATQGATTDSMGCKNPSGPISKSPIDKTPDVKPGLVSETAAKLGKVLSPAPESHENALVFSLINQGERCWKVAEIDNLFLPEEAEIIKAIPLSLFDRDDFLLWQYTRDGSYSFKSGYRLLMEQEETAMSGTRNDGVNSNVWKAIWSLQVPNRVRILLWRAGINSLPTKVNLVRQKILNEDVCTECKAQPEDTLHALLTCSKLKDMWNIQFSRLMAVTGSCSSFLEILEHVSKDKSSFEQFAMTISEVWQRRNRARVGETVVPVHVLPHKALGALHKFQHLRPIHTDIPRTAHAVKWITRTGLLGLR
nr:putative ribonuclease h protein [Quercus suber]